MTQGEYDDWRYNYPEDLPENIINTLDHCWDKAQKENKKIAKKASLSDLDHQDL